MIGGRSQGPPRSAGARPPLGSPQVLLQACVRKFLRLPINIYINRSASHEPPRFARCADARAEPK